MLTTAATKTYMNIDGIPDIVGIDDGAKTSTLPVLDLGHALIAPGVSELNPYNPDLRGFSPSARLSHYFITNLAD
jgi:hypothetical protein